MSFLTSTLKRALLLRPHAPATICASQTRTWAEVAERVAKLASCLLELGLRPNDRVAVMCLNSDRYFELYFAILWAGGVIVPVNWRWSEAEISQCFEDCSPRILVSDDSFADLAVSLKARSGSIAAMIHTGKPGSGELEYESALASFAQATDASRNGNELAGLFYTGGTTGRSKGVMLSHDNIMWSLLAYLAHTRPDENDIYLHVAPMFHVADMASVFGITAAAGTHVFAPRFDPDETLRLIEQHAVSCLTLVPTMLQMLLDRPHGASTMARHLRRVMYGASPISQTLLRRAMDSLPGCDFVQCYGMTELAPVATILSATDHRIGSGAHLTSAGRPAYGVELRVVDDQDNARAAGEVGEIIVRGSNVMLGYWNNARETAQALRSGWMHTGDAGYLDADGYLHLVDRLKDMIVVGGENVYCIEVENVLATLPEVVQCAVVGIPHEKWGEAVHAVIVVQPGARLDAERIDAHCRQHLAGYKRPTSVEFRTQPLALSGVGKILKGQLRDPHWSNRARRIG